MLQSLNDLSELYPRGVVAGEVRHALAEARADLQCGQQPSLPIQEKVRARLRRLSEPSLRRVINATGVVLHTNLGRAPLPASPPVHGYSNLEYDLATGKRGRRDAHVERLLEALLGVPAIVVNNNAAAIYLALNELASGFEVLVSRGELIEIGDGFRIPDIMRSSGALLREVGTTNRTRIEDYAGAITERTRLLLRVHPSNFHITGFTAKPDLAALAALGRERGLPVYEDLGSGCLRDLRAFGIREPLVAESLRAGVNLVSFSGDKLLGGPQAGLLAGDADLVFRLRRNPMFRALRVDKLIYGNLETLLRHQLFEEWDAIPALRMISEPAARVRARAQALLERTGCVSASVIVGSSVIGGGSTPSQEIPTYLIALDVQDAAAAERRCRQHQPPVIARIQDGQLLFDLRSVLPEEEDELAALFCSLAAAPGT